MKKNTLLYILLGFLIIVNGFFLFNHLSKPNFEKPRGNHENFIVRELKFDDDQKQKFEKLKSEHFKRIEKIFDEERQLKDDLFDRISNENINTVQVDSITNLIGELASAKEQETFNHFRDIQNICNDNQKDKFKRIIRQALHGKKRNGRGAPQPR